MQRLYKSGIYNTRGEAAQARGIEAEPPKRKPLAAKREGDGADSPTRAGEAREAARPNY